MYENYSRNIFFTSTLSTQFSLGILYDYAQSLNMCHMEICDICMQIGTSGLITYFSSIIENPSAGCPIYLHYVHSHRVMNVMKTIMMTYHLYADYTQLLLRCKPLTSVPPTPAYGITMDASKFRQRKDRVTYCH